jgi:hypothetical protein
MAWWVELVVETLGTTGWSFWPQVENRLLAKRQITARSGARRARTVAADRGWIEVFTPRGVAVAGRSSQLVRLTAAGRAVYRERAGQEAGCGEWDCLLPHCAADLTCLYLAVVAIRDLRQSAWQVDPRDPLHFTRGPYEWARLQPCAIAADLELNLDLPPAQHPSSLYAICADKPTRLRVHDQLSGWVDYTGGLAYTTTPYDLSHETWWLVTGTVPARAWQLALL